MPEYELSVTRILPFKSRTKDSVLKRKKGSDKTLILTYFRLCKLRHGEFKESLVTTIDVCQLPSFVFPNQCDLYLHPLH